MKNILLLGDSIRMLYQPGVKEALKGRANVFGPAENGRWSGYTLNSLRFWQPGMPDPDIVHWNNGIWDMGDDYDLGRPFTLPEEYAAILDRTVCVLHKLWGDSLAIILATTTPIRGGDLARTQKYNGIMREVAAKHGLEVDDLYECVSADVEGYIGQDNVHLTPEGVKVVTSRVVGCLEKYL